MTKTEHFTLRLEKPLKQALKVMSHKNKRSMGKEVAILIEEAAKKHGIELPDEAIAA